jgi:DNA repair exonuclease SbcCD ATPase subunit
MARNVQERERELEARQQELESKLGAAEADRMRLEQWSAATDDGRRQLESDRAELVGARQALATKEAEIARADEAARARYAELEAELQGRMKEVAQARASVAMLQSQLEAEGHSVTHQGTSLRPQHGLVEGEPKSGEIPTPDALEALESVGRLQKLSRDARQIALGGGPPRATRPGSGSERWR